MLPVHVLLPSAGDLPWGAHGTEKKAPGLPVPPGHTHVCPLNKRVYRSLRTQSSVPGKHCRRLPRQPRAQKACLHPCALPPTGFVNAKQSSPPHKACLRAQPRRGAELPRNAELLTPSSERQVRIEGQAMPLQLLPRPLMLPCGAARTHTCAPHTPLAETLAQRTVLSRAPRGRAKTCTHELLGMLGYGISLSPGAPEPPTSDHRAHTLRTRFCRSRSEERRPRPAPAADKHSGPERC